MSLVAVDGCLQELFPLAARGPREWPWTGLGGGLLAWALLPLVQEGMWNEGCDMLQTGKVLWLR